MKQFHILTYKTNYFKYYHDEPNKVKSNRLEFYVCHHSLVETLTKFKRKTVHFFKKYILNIFLFIYLITYLEYIIYLEYIFIFLFNIYSLKQTKKNQYINIRVIQKVIIKK